MNKSFKVVSALTYEIKIYLAGDIHTIRKTCRDYCYDVGLCVTVTECDFPYRGGLESGACIGLLEYPRFISGQDMVKKKAMGLAEKLMIECSQLSILVVEPEETFWLYREGKLYDKNKTKN